MKVMNVTNPNRGILARSPHLSTIHEKVKMKTTPKLGLMAWKIVSVRLPRLSQIFVPCSC